MEEKDLELLLASLEIDQKTHDDARDMYGELHYLKSQLPWVTETHLTSTLDYTESVDGDELIERLDFLEKTGDGDFAMDDLDVDKAALLQEEDIDEVFLRPVLAVKLEYSGEDGFKRCIEDIGEQVDTEENREVFVEKTPSTPEEAIEEIENAIQSLDLSIHSTFTGETYEMVGVCFEGIDISQ